MSVEQIEVYKSLENIVKFFKNIAIERKLLDKDINKIFTFKYVDPEIINTRNISINVKEDREICFDLDDKVIEVIGKNQIGKTTSIIYIANLLGYDFFNHNNIDFLKDEQVIDRGKEIYRNIVNGMDCYLVLNINNKELSIRTKKGLLNLVYNNNSDIYEDTYNLETQSNAYRNIIKNYIDVIFISKGRDFITQVLIDVIKDMQYIYYYIKKNGDNLISNIRVKYSDLLEKSSIENGVDIFDRRQKLKKDLNDAIITYEIAYENYENILLKQDNLKRILEDLIGTEKYDCFKFKKDLYNLKKNINKLNQRKEILEKYESDYKQIVDRIEDINNEIKILISNKSDTSNFYQKFNELVKTCINDFNKINNQFFERSNYENIISSLRNKNIEYIIDIDNLFDHKAKRAIEDIYEVINKHDSDIKLPDELGGNMGNFKNIINDKRTEIIDNNLILYYCSDLIILLKENNVISNYKLKEVEDYLENVNNEIKQLKEELEELLKVKERGFDNQDRKYLIETKKNIEKLKIKIVGIIVKLDKCNLKEKNTLEELVRLIKTIDSNPEDILYSDDVEDLLIKKREEIESLIEECKLDYITKKTFKEDIEKEIYILDGYIKDPQIQEILSRLDNLRYYVTDINLINQLMNKHNILLENNITDDLYKLLSRRNIIIKLNNLINEIFISKCKNLYILKKDDFIIEKINNFDYKSKVFEYDNKKINISNISGGTGSVLTVLTLASSNKKSEMGLLILVDEFNDVVGDLRKIALKNIQDLQNISFTFLVKPVEDANLTFQSLDFGV